jgi:hypothetical protein
MTLQCGDWVEALVFDRIWRRNRIHQGRIYRVEEVDPTFGIGATCSGCGPTCRGVGVRLVGEKLPSTRMWCSSSFRLVYRPKTTTVQNLYGREMFDHRLSH